MRVSQLWTYPVKSMVGVQVPSIGVSELGIVGDRHWAIRDNERGGIRGAKKIGDLMQFTARPIGDQSSHVVITLPDGSEILSSDENVHTVLSEALHHSVTLESLPATDNIEHFRRGAADSADVMAELRGIFGRTEDEPLPDFSVFPSEVGEFESPLGTHHDCWPLMVMTTSALTALQDALPDSVVDVLRFRPSIVVETSHHEGHIEFSWKGRTARIGTAVVEFLDPCPRCIMITRRINENIPEDRNILRHVVRDLNQAVGVYARITTPGSISLDDELTFL
jgi:uncharacterized protein YcbX